MSIENERNQHPVGQGFFHSGFLFENGTMRLSYIYDCGAMHRYEAARKREIQRYLKQVGVGISIDVVFISHIHADHINGLEQLLDANTGATVDTIVLPLTNVSDRLIAYARTVAEDSSSAHNNFFRDFIVNPGAALERFNPRQIIFVSPGRREDGAPDGDDRPFTMPDGPQVLGPNIEKREIAWKLVGRGLVRKLDDDPDTSSDQRSRTVLYEASDTLALLSSDSRTDWLLAPFVDPTVRADRKKFLTELAKQCGVARSKISSWLSVSSNIQNLLTVDLDLLAAAYGAVTGELNITSLCLYSGPASRVDPKLRRSVEGIFGCVNNWDSGSKARIAWLATGDAALKQKQRRADFINHYGKLLKNVSTMTLPHHGSDNNFDDQLLSEVRPRVCLAAADRYGTWKHPGPHTVQAVCSHPAVLQVVTSNRRSRARERAFLG